MEGTGGVVWGNRAKRRTIPDRRARMAEWRGASGNVDSDGITGPNGWQDPLTGLEGPDYWQRVLVAEITRALRYRRPLTVVMVELTGVPELIEKWGPDVGRLAVREAARRLRRTSRSSDHCTRIGPTRFGVVLTETGEIAAINFVERVRESGPGLMPETGDGLVFCFGWASPKLGESVEAIVQRAGQRLEADLTAVTTSNVPG